MHVFQSFILLSTQIQINSYLPDGLFSKHLKGFSIIKLKKLRCHERYSTSGTSFALITWRLIYSLFQAYALFPCLTDRAAIIILENERPICFFCFFCFVFCVTQSSQYEFLTGFYYYGMFNFFHRFIDHLKYKKSVQKVSIYYFKGEHYKNKIQTNKPKQSI